MKIVINHLTRMQKGFMCVAGIDLATGRHVRPMLQSQMRTKFLARHGGPFDIGAIVELGWTKHVGEPPAVEDFLFHRTEAERVDDMAPDIFWQLLRESARPKFREIFGDELRRRGPRSYGIDAGKGIASLGCYVTQGRPRVYAQRRHEQSRGRVRMAFRDGPYEFDLGVTDIRLFGPDHFTPDPVVVKRTGQHIQEAGEVVLSVGLSRPYQGSDARDPLHWLQVNNIHFQHDACWRLD